MTRESIDVISINDAKRLARELSRGSDLTHSSVLEAVAHAAGCRDWNTFSALGERAQAPDPVGRQQVVPILRIFDVAQAREFYVEYLGFEWVWQHEFGPDFPTYAEVVRDGSVLHLSEHHGDATPGSAVMIVVDDVRALCDELLARPYRHARPAVEEVEWGLTMTLTDPFGNRLVFWTRP